MKRIRIVSTGGSAEGTRIFIGDEEIKCVSKIEIDPIVADGFLLARLTCLSELDIEADAEIVGNG